MADEGGGGDSGFGFIIICVSFLLTLWVFSYFNPDPTGLNPENLNRGSSTPSFTTPRSALPKDREDIEREIDKYYAHTEELREKITDAKLWGDISPYAGTIAFLGVGGASSNNARNEYVLLSTAYDNDTDISISGWRIESAVTGKSAEIPKGTRTAYRGRVNVTVPIMLSPSETAVISTGNSPIGVSFHENTCTGYLSEYQDFFPSLRSTCPLPQEEMKRFGAISLDDDSCYEFVERLSSCTDPTKTSMNETSLSSSCEEFIDENLTYNSCIQNHQYEPRFISGDWRVYLGENRELWRSEREILRLLDEKGRTVDVIEF